ncbi:hypothetical protein SLEP1_g53441 [Rubroshorea leprosula]|uniref:Uncharacterized protein n=1 Tax=Rubroshorea leprosula TaxID=152421 RepID=A0AAV5M9K6_9ROSI|nr:hypothetical protein SLEP1_g53441 [Rubroshorea leprosula]
MARSYSHGHTIGAQGGTLKRQQALSVEALMLGSWHKVADKTRGNVREQSRATCMCVQEWPGSRHGCTHKQHGLRRWHAWVQSGLRRWHAQERQKALRKRATPAAETILTLDFTKGFRCRYLGKIWSRLENSQSSNVCWNGSRQEFGRVHWAKLV